jgi:hypothetical protein
MPKPYTPKTSYLSSERIDKIAKDSIQSCEEDRKLALEAYRHFKALAEAEGATAVDKQLMLEALKIVQGAKKDIVKIIDIFLKAPAKVASAKSEPSDKMSFDEITAKIRQHND